MKPGSFSGYVLPRVEFDGGLDLVLFSSLANLGGEARVFMENEEPD
jgi:hypothetical protein